MRRRISWLVLLVALSRLAQTSVAAPTTIGELRQQLAARLADRRFAPAQWGVKIVSIETGKTLFEHDAGKLLSPASNTKLFTCALALDRFGPDHRFRTSLLATHRPDGEGVLRGDLIVYGRGDPSITSQRGQGDIHRVLDPLVAALTNAGVRVIHGDLVGDDSYLPGPRLGSGWDWDDPQHAYGAELSALSINDNVLRLIARPATQADTLAELTIEPATSHVQLVNQVRTVSRGETRNISVFRPPGGNLLFVGGQVRIGAVASTNLITVHEPAALFIALLRESLERAGVSLRGRVRTIGWRERLEEPLPWNRWMELAFVESPPLQELVRETMKRSQNLYAALLLQCVGVQLTSTNSFESAEVRGARALSAFLEQVGLNRRDYFFNEGSGLSRENLVTANGVVSLLIFMSRHAAAEIFTSALPVAGVDGTLERRMNGTSAAKNVRAKTGALRWANALSGYVTTAAGERLAFALLLNRHQEGESNGSAQQELDGIAVWLAGLRQHSRNWKP